MKKITSAIVILVMFAVLLASAYLYYLIPRHAAVSAHAGVQGDDEELLRWELFCLNFNESGRLFGIELSQYHPDAHFQFSMVDEGEQTPTNDVLYNLGTMETLYVILDDEVLYDIAAGMIALEDL